jgi:hypothetical protein
MKFPVGFAAWLCFVAAAAVAGAQSDPLARARLLYNQRQFQAAVAAAEEARSFPEKADSADLIAARAYLEHYRESAAAEDLSNARDRLRRIDPAHLAARERTELIVGLGQGLFFDDAAGAAAGIFESVLGGTSLTSDARERVLDWWASALDKEARSGRVGNGYERYLMYQQIRERMQNELAGDPANATASYWLSAAALGQGDYQAAWDAAQAGWVRAPLTSDRGAALRGDLDRLVLRAIVPGRAKALAVPAAAVEADWGAFKERWSR